MKSKKSLWRTIGAIILESILFVEVAVELYTGEKNLSDFGIIITFCLLLAIPFVMIMKWKRKKMYNAPVEQTSNNSEVDDNTRK